MIILKAVKKIYIIFLFYSMFKNVLTVCAISNHFVYEMFISVQ